jgi:hypothetical protein
MGADRPAQPADPVPPARALRPHRGHGERRQLRRCYGMLQSFWRSGGAGSGGKPDKAGAEF